MRNVVSAAVMVALLLIVGAPLFVPVSAQKTKNPAASAAGAGIIEIGEGKDGKFRFFVRDREGKILAISGPGGFATADDARTAIQKLKEIVRTAKVTATNRNQIAIAGTARPARVEQLQSLCDKYALGFPIKVRHGNDARAIENVLVSALLKELLKGGATKWVSIVAFTGDSIVVTGTYNESPFGGRSDDELKKALALDIQRRTGNLFSGPVLANVRCEITRLTGFEHINVVLARNLKDEFINRSPNAVELNGLRLGDTINFDAVWRAVLGSGKPERGLEIDLNSATTDNKTRTRMVSTLEAIEEYDGFVTRYRTGVTLRETIGDGPADSVVLEVLVHGERRRAAAAKWTEFNVGESVHASGPGGNLAVYQTGIPLMDAIITRLKK